jgi:methyl coenzyme M reductase alpha subunit|tara:strand:- start:594 stop:950 length:357 start_codon:yes stop_codon:yes gene_type:complete
MIHDPHVIVSGDREDPTTGPLWVVGLAGAVLTVVTVLGVTSIYYAAERAEVQHKVMSVRSQEAGLRREADRMALMNEAHWEQWTDADGVLSGERTLIVPMDTARDIVKKRWGSSGGGR